MQEHLGRALNKDEVVHHINGDKKDNRLKNLKLMSLSEHSKKEMIGKKNSLGVRRETHKFKDGKYWCNRCEKYLKKEDFWPNRFKKYGVRVYCKKCDKIKSL